MSRLSIPITQETLATHILNAFKENNKYDYQEWLDNQDIKFNDNPIKLINNGYGIPWTNLTPHVTKDLEKVHFDTENVTTLKNEWNSHSNQSMNKVLGFNTLDNNFTFLGVWAGGDWEIPVLFIIYWDSKKLRAYIPKDGNTWNTDSKEAYGNDEIPDDLNICKRLPHDITDKYNKDDILEASAFVDYLTDGNKIIEDIKNRIKVK